eukprot:TRINITY_DN9719_c0_g1_i1.p1 TRINITY_DN9719_c0_g1~~TRINITY_DN9719_c0_g1_i1.p1  ORF type:complete len:128 (-),score=28.67 TRINITY_DN9719_c0_g1_i1:178-561(-)
MTSRDIFAELVAGHQQKQSALKDSTERAKKEALETVGAVVDALVDCVNSGVQDVFLTEKRIDFEARAFTTTVQRFVKQKAQWVALFQSFDGALKEVGDFENWIKNIEYDMQTVASALQRVSSRPQAA